MKTCTILYVSYLYRVLTTFTLCGNGMDVQLLSCWLGLFAHGTSISDLLKTKKIFYPNKAALLYVFVLLF